MTLIAAIHGQSLPARPTGFCKDYCLDPNQPGQPYGKACILTADDEPLVLFTQRAILEIAGYEVVIAADGREALEKFASHRVDLAILDFRMPELDGGAVARELKRQRPLPVILLSGGEVDEEAKASADCFLSKGQSPALLLREVERLLARFKMPVRSTPVV